MIKQTYKRLKEEKGDDGFTLIELLIVIVILGILAAIVVFAVGGITDKGTKAACRSDVKTLTVASEAFYAKTGGYAATLDLLWTAPNKFANQPDGTLDGAKLVYTAPAPSTYTITYAPGTGNFTNTCP
jgi:prepilin-type N-terminal cleavage/methylation domain-containing protein